MDYFALIYDVVDDFVARRAPLREAHLCHARAAHDRGEIVLAGALAEPSDRALIVFRVNNRSTVEDFARKDPYVVNDLVKRWEVRPWKVVIGNQSPARTNRHSQTPLVCPHHGRSTAPLSRTLFKHSDSHFAWHSRLSWRLSFRAPHWARSRSAGRNGLALS